MVLGNPKYLTTPIFGTIEVVEGHAVLVPEGVLAVVITLAEWVSTEPFRQPEVEDPVVVVEDRAIYGQPCNRQPSMPFCILMPPMFTVLLDALVRFSALGLY